MRSLVNPSWFPFAAALLAAMLIAGRAGAQTAINVNTVIDLPDFDPLDGLCDCDQMTPGPQCSLRAAVENANFIGGWVIINIPGGIFDLTNWGLENAGRFGDLDIYSATLTRLDIAGVGMGNTIISGAGLQAVGAPERVLDIRSTVSTSLAVTLTDLSIASGYAAALGETKGGGIRLSGGALTLKSCMIESCQSNDDGGGIWHEAGTTLTLTDSFIVGNAASVLDSGGGIQLDSGSSLQMTGGAINGNSSGLRGGGLRISSGCSVKLDTVDILANSSGSGAGVSNDGTFTARGGVHRLNVATGSGGAYENRISATLEIRGVNIDTNTAQFGGALNNSGTATIDECWIASNTAETGGGIQNNFGMTVTMTNSTVSFNTATSAIGGGGMLNSGRFVATNCTISNNRAPSGFGGGIYFTGNTQTMDLASVTIAQNSAGNAGGGVFIDGTLGSSALNIIGTLLADNTVIGLGNNNFLGAYLMTSAGFNLDTDGSCALAAPGDQSVVPANIGPLQNNGGFAPTHELLPGSLAIDHGACFDHAGNAITEDQRGVSRVGACDVGAFEAPGPSNDDCPNAQLVTGNFVWDNCGATTDGPARPCGFTGIDDKDVWFEFVMPCDGTWVVDVGPSSVAMLVGVYDACPQSGGGLLACDAQPAGAPVNIAIIGIAGQSYWIRVGSSGGCGNAPAMVTFACNTPCLGDCVSNVTFAPPPDGTVDAADLASLLGSWGPCPAGVCCADLVTSGTFAPPPDGVVDAADLAALLGNWGPCP